MVLGFSHLRRGVCGFGGLGVFRASGVEGFVGGCFRVSKKNGLSFAEASQSLQQAVHAGCVSRKGLN